MGFVQRRTLSGGPVQLLTELQVVRPAPAANPVHYERRRPEETTLYQLVQEHLETFLAHVEAETGAGLPDFVKAEGIESDCARGKGEQDVSSQSGSF